MFALWQSPPSASQLVVWIGFESKPPIQPNNPVSGFLASAKRTRSTSKRFREHGVPTKHLTFRHWFKELNGLRCLCLIAGCSQRVTPQNGSFRCPFGFLRHQEELGDNRWHNLAPCWFSHPPFGGLINAPGLQMTGKYQILLVAFQPTVNPHMLLSHTLIFVRILRTKPPPLP